MDAPVKQRTRDWLWLGLLAYMLVVGLYFAGRYAGQWAESDSATFTELIRGFVRDGRLIPGGREVYPNGYAFQAISTFIIALTGLDVVTLQQLVYPLLACMVVLPAWLLYRELTGSAGGATLTAVLLFTQPELLFVILRSSHEKFTRTLMLLCLYLLFRSLKLDKRPWLLAAQIMLFYLTAFAFIASNNLMAHSFIFAVAVALVGGWLLAKRNATLEQHNQYVLKRLFYATLICLILDYVFTFYAYPPAEHDLLVLQSIWDRIAALFLDVQAQATNPYSYVEEAWVGAPVSSYFLVSIANWIVLFTSLLIWSYQGLRWFWRRDPPRAQTEWLLWLLYAAFALQGGLSVVADFSGVLSSNLQHRLFPSFSMIAVALIGVALARWRPRRYAREIALALSLGVFCIAILSVFKSTNEPVLSNKWTFYRADELAALEWSDAHLKNTGVWTEFDERLSSAFRTVVGDSANHNEFIGGPMAATARTMLLTSITRLRSSRLLRPLPVPPDALRIYDNGDAELYRLRSLSPYQP